MNYEVFIIISSIFCVDSNKVFHLCQFNGLKSIHKRDLCLSLLHSLNQIEIHYLCTVTSSLNSESELDFTNR